MKNNSGTYTNITDITESSSGITSAVPIPFSTEAMGYNRQQVDSYLQKLMSEYDSLQQSYTELLGKNDALTKQPDADMVAIAKTTANAHRNAKRIVAQAETESSELIGEAKAEAAALLKNAKAEASGLIREANQNLTLIKNEKTQLLDYLDGIANRLRHFDRENKPGPARKSILVSIRR